ncbi:unnamed protein product [Urochloa humidicola]
MTGALAFYLLEAAAHGAAAGMTTPGAATSAGSRSIPSLHGSSEPGILLAASICEARRPRIGETGSSSIGGRSTLARILTSLQIRDGSSMPASSDAGLTVQESCKHPSQPLWKEQQFCI